MNKQQRRFGHTQTLSPKPIDKLNTFMVGFANVPLRYKAQTTFSLGGGLYDQIRIPALQSEELRHRRKDSNSKDFKSLEAQRLRVFDIRRQEPRVQDWGLHTDKTQKVVNCGI